MDFTNAIRKQSYSLKEAKNRRVLGMFKAEGTKCVLDTIRHFDVEYLIATARWLDAHSKDIPLCPVISVTAKDLAKVSSFSTPSDVVAVYRIPDYKCDMNIARDELCLALDCIQDPGNLGTIIRTADWFGIRHIFCSRDTVDVYSPKVVQATMGAISRVKVFYLDIAEELKRLNDANIYGTFLDGENIYTKELSSNGVVVMGNEGSGISSELAGLINSRLFIPSYPPGVATSESLNVATATAITLAEFRRRLLNV
ncbi:MAG: RNA methyltransferase [Bacteroides sp.]|nr:RNA methyltransferase [Bacteroides sp.]